MSPTSSSFHEVNQMQAPWISEQALRDQRDHVGRGPYGIQDFGVRHPRSAEVDARVMAAELQRQCRACAAAFWLAAY